MPGHPENATTGYTFLRRMEAMMDESFRRAERIVRKSADRANIKGEDERERFMAMTVPFTSERIGNAISGYVHMMLQAPPDSATKVFEAGVQIHRDIKRINDEAAQQEREES